DLFQNQKPPPRTKTKTKKYNRKNAKMFCFSLKNKEGVGHPAANRGLKLLPTRKRGERNMGKVYFGMIVSLDGFINDRYGKIDKLYETYQPHYEFPGAVVMGRNSFNMAGDPD